MAIGDLLAALPGLAGRAGAGARIVLRGWWSVQRDMCIVFGCLVALYLARAAWDSLQMRTGTAVGTLKALLPAVALLVQGIFNLVCILLNVWVLVFVSRLPPSLCIWCIGSGSRTKRLLAYWLSYASLFFTVPLLGSYYLGAENMFARGVAVRRALYDAAAANSTSSAELLVGRALARGAADEAAWPYY